MSDRADDHTRNPDWRSRKREGFIPWRIRMLVIDESFCFKLADWDRYIGERANTTLRERVTYYISKEKRRARLDPEYPEDKFFAWLETREGVLVVRRATGKPRKPYTKRATT